VLASGHLLGFYHYLGDAMQARALLEILDRDARDVTLSPALRFHALRAAFVFYWMTGEPQSGLQAASEAARLCDEHGLHAFGATLATTHLLAHLALGNIRKIRECVARLSSINPVQYLNASHLHWVLAWAAWVTGDLAEAKVRMALSFANTVRAGSPFPSAYAHIALAVLHLESGELADAAARLDEARGIGSAMDSATILHHCALLDASLALTAGDEPACLDALREAFTIGKTHGLYHSYWWDRKRASRLCALALRRGIEPEYARAMVRRTRLAPDLSEGLLLEWPWPIRIYAFGNFRLVLETARGKPVAGGARKVMALLKLLVAARGQSVSAAYATEQLWPDAEGDTAHGALKTTVHRLRRHLDCPEAVVLGDGLVSLNSELCWTDVGAFERLLNDERSDPAHLERLQQAIALYAGTLLPGDGASHWVIGPRERARSEFLHAVGDLAESWEAQNRWDDAVAVYERGLEVDDLIESFYSGLMRCHERLGQRAQALESYERCCRVLAARFAIEPGPEITAFAREFGHRD
jgi:LuxR family maltose regulon positive regulatory protein